MASPYQALYDQFEYGQGSQPLPTWQPTQPTINYSPYQPPAGGDYSGGSNLQQFPNTEVQPTPDNMPQPGVSLTRQGAWGLPDPGVLGNFGMPTPPAAQTTGGAEQPPLTPNDAGYWTGRNAEIIGNWAQVMPTILNLLQNASQFSQEFGEGNRRFDAEFQRTLGNDAYQRELTQRQQGFQEQQASLQQDNFVRQLQWQMGNDMAAREIANRETAVLEGRLGVEEAAQRWNEIYQQRMLELEGERIDQQREAARYAAFGRAQAPVQWRGNWR